MRSAPWRRRASSGGAEGEGHDGGQAGQRENVDGVVVEDRDNLKGFRGAQVIEVTVRNHLAGQVALPLHAENLVFQVHQTAAFQAQLP